MPSIGASILSAAVRGLAVLLIATGAAPACQAATAPLVVQLDSGLVSGTDGVAHAWRGIPYAAAPVGDRRWRPPAPPETWTGIRDATLAGPVCAQPAPDALGGWTLAGSEDCLTLNVFTPPAAAARDLPVMVFIHGGGQLYGTGNTFDGSRLAATQDVIVVTVNYRLGPFGWFHHPAITRADAQPVTGQFALLDLIAALRWVRRNIAAFGGDAGNVTIFGESAGAQNVYALVLAPSARGLFHKAIAESGGFWNMTRDQAVNDRDAAVPGTPLSAREVVARLLAASGRADGPAAGRALQDAEAPASLARWLRELPVEAVLAPYAAANHAEYDLPSVVYDGVLIPGADHHRQLARGDYNAVPMIVGGNRDEEKAFLSSDPSLVRAVGGHLEIRNRAEYATLDRLYSAWWNLMAVDDLLPRVRTPVFAYRFDWDDEPTAPTDLRAIYGAAHGLELAFVFGDFRYSFVHDELPDTADGGRVEDPFASLFNGANRASRERTSSAMMSYWAEFARRGDPGTGGAHDLPRWKSWQESHRKLVFGSAGLRQAGGLIDGGALVRALRRSPDLSHAEKCTVLLDNTMYPAYALDLLAEWHCPR